MSILPLDIIADADARVPNDLPTSKKLSWLNQLEEKIRSSVKCEFAEYFVTVDDNQPYALPVPFEQVERIYRNGTPVKKLDLRSLTDLPRGEYRIVYRIPATPFSDVVYCDEHAVFGTDSITFSGVHPFMPGDLIGILGSGANDISATVVAVDGVLVTLDHNGFTPGEMSATVCKLDDRQTEIPKDHAYFGIYEEYLCAQIAKHLCDTERYRLAMTEFERLFSEYACWYKKSAPQTSAARVRGLFG